MAENTFTTTDSGKEYPARFAGMEFRYNAPEAVAGDVEATLDNLRAVCADGEDFAVILANKFNGQGFHLDWQKELKSFLGRTEKVDGTELSVHRDREPAEVQELAVAHMAEFRLTATVRRSGGGGGKVAKITAERDAVKESALDMYLQLPKGMRKQFRGQLIEKGHFTAEELDAVDAEG